MIDLSKIIQKKIDAASLQGFHVMPREIKDFRINDFVPVRISILSGNIPGGITGIPGFNRLHEVLGLVDVDGYVFRYAQAEKKENILKIFFRVQMGTVKERMPKEKKHEPEPEPIKKKEEITETVAPEPEPENAVTKIKSENKKHKKSIKKEITINEEVKNG